MVSYSRSKQNAGIAIMTAISGILLAVTGIGVSKTIKEKRKNKKGKLS